MLGETHSREWQQDRASWNVYLAHFILFRIPSGDGYHIPLQIQT